MNRCTLIVDGNWLCLNKASFINFDIQDDAVIKQSKKLQLKQFMSDGLTYILNKFESIITNIVIVSDGRSSWRKSLDIPQSRAEEGVTYKGNRGKNQSFDANSVFGALNEFLEACKKAGIQVLNATSVEGDDWIWRLSNLFNNSHTSAIIWSSDQDLKQLIKYNNRSFIGWYNNKTMFLHSSCNNQIPTSQEGLDIVEMMLDGRFEQPVLQNLLSSPIQIEYMLPGDVVMKKIITGDVSDNIKAILRKKINEKFTNVTEKMWEETKESLKINNLTEFFDRKSEIITNLLNHKKFKNSGISYEEADSLFEYNKRLVWLETSSYPTTILESIESCISEDVIKKINNFDISLIKSNSKYILQFDEQASEINDIDFLFSSI